MYKHEFDLMLHGGMCLSIYRRKDEEWERHDRHLKQLSRSSIARLQRLMNTLPMTIDTTALTWSYRFDEQEAA